MDRDEEIPVTQAMEDAGFRVLSESGIAEGYTGADRLMVAEIYRAMVAAKETFGPAPGCFGWTGNTFRGLAERQSPPSEKRIGTCDCCGTEDIEVDDVRYVDGLLHPQCRICREGDSV